MNESGLTSARDVEILDDELAYDGFYKVRRLTLRHRLFAGGWSAPLRRELVHRHAAVVILLYDPARDAVAMLEQFRIGAITRSDEPWLLELVAGLIDCDESPEEVGRREAMEEAGCDVQTLEPICQYFSSPGGSDEFVHLYCGRCDLGDVGGLHGLADEGEDIRVQVLPVAEVLALLAAGRIRNAHTLIALQWLQLNRERLRALWLGRPADR